MPARASKKRSVAAKGLTRPVKPVRKSAARPSAGKYNDIRKDLEQQRAELLEEAAVIMNKSDTELYPDLSDQATAEFDQSFEIRLKEREQKLLKKIDGALKRIAQKTYGICERCGEKIPHQRLKARPVTTLCIECKTLQEEEERIRG